MTDTTSHIATDSYFPPNGWTETTLGEVVEIQPGFAFKSKDFDTNEGFSVIKIKNIQPPIIKIERTDVVDISNYSEEKLEKFKVENGQYLIAMTGETIGKVGKYNLGDFAYINQRVCKIVETEKSDYSFIYYTLLQNSFQKFINTHSFGAAQANISTDQIGKYKVFLPPLPEQQAIASALSAFDDKIELLREQNKTLEEMGQVVFREWFGKYGVDDDKVNAEGREGGLGQLPDGWRVGKLGEICEITSGKRPENISETKTELNQIPLLGATKIMGFVENYLFDGKTLIIGRVGTHGEVQRFNEKIFPSDNTLVIKSDDFVFVYQILKSIDYVKMNRGAVQPLITQTDLKNYEIIIPSDEILQNFKEATNPIFEKIDQNNSQIQSLARSRDELLPRLMRGEVRVKL